MQKNVITLQRTLMLFIVSLIGTAAHADSSASYSQRLYAMKIANFFKNPELAKYEECIMESVLSWNFGKTNVSQQSAHQAVNRICLKTLRNLYFSNSYLSQNVSNDAVAEMFVLGDVYNQEIAARSVKTEDQLKELFPIYPENKSYKKVNATNATDYYAFLFREHQRVQRIAKSLGF